MLRRQLSASLLSLFLLLGGLSPATAQSVESVVENMQAKYNQQLETVDTYIVETNLYTSYNKKVMRDGEPTYETRTQTKGAGSQSFASARTPSSAYGLQFDRLKQHATYAGTETIDGVRCHVLQVDDPSNVDPEMNQKAESITYYIDAERHVPARLVMQAKRQRSTGPQASSITIDMKNYKTIDGLTLPHRLEMQFQMGMSEQQRRRIEQLMKQMKNMPQAQREQMQKTLGEQMKTMKQMMSDDPVVVEVQDVQVNTEIPDGIF